MDVDPEVQLKVRMLSLFPDDCRMRTTADGGLSVPAGFILDEWVEQYMKPDGKLEHPCYGCHEDDCTSRQVEYHDDNRRYITDPRL